MEELKMFAKSLERMTDRNALKLAASDYWTNLLHLNKPLT